MGLFVSPGVGTEGRGFPPDAALPAMGTTPGSHLPCGWAVSREDFWGVRAARSRGMEQSVVSSFPGLGAKPELGGCAVHGDGTGRGRERTVLRALPSAAPPGPSRGAEPLPRACVRGGEGVGGRAGRSRLFHCPLRPALCNARSAAATWVRTGVRGLCLGLRMPRGNGKGRKERDAGREEEAVGTLEAAVREARRRTAPSVRDFRYNKQRARLVSRGSELKEGAECILYWMCRDQRVQGRSRPRALQCWVLWGGSY